MSEERVIPSLCPNCKSLLASGYDWHCEGGRCSWVKCRFCEANIDTRTGRCSGGKPVE